MKTLTEQLLEKSHYYALRAQRREAHANAIEGKPYDRKFNLDESTRWRDPDAFRHYAERDRIRVKYMRQEDSIYPIWDDERDSEIRGSIRPS